MILQWLYFVFLFLYSTSLFSIQERDLFFLDNINFFFLQVGFYPFAWILPFLLFAVHSFYLNQRFTQEKFFDNINLFNWKIYPHSDKFIQNMQFLFHHVVIVIHIFLNIFFIFICPIYLLTFTLLKFSKVQDLFLSWYHFILVFFNAWLVVFYFFYTKKEFQIYFKVLKNHFINQIFQILLQSIHYFLVGILFIFSLVNIYFQSSILLKEQNQEIYEYKLNSLFLFFNPLFYETSKEYTFLFPRLNLPYQNLLVGKNIYFVKRNFRYANFEGSKLNFLSFHLANTNFANFSNVEWKQN